MNPVARRILFSLAILGWGAVLLYFHSSGRIVKYLAPDFRPIALAGGLGLAVLGLFNLFYCHVSTSCGHDHGDGGACHDHEAPDLHPLAILLLMMLPVGFAVAWTKDEYSASTLARKGLYETPASTPTFLAGSLPALTREEIEKSHSKTPDGYYEFSLMELFYSTGDRDLQNAINGLKVETEGRWVDEKVRNPNGTRKRLYRLFITCCAADSRAVPIILEFGKTPPNQEENGWVKVAGTMTFPLEEGIVQPVLRVDRALAAEPPYEESFLRN